MSDTVIEVDSLWKKYRLGVLGTGTLSHDLNRWWHRLRGQPDPYAKVDAVQRSEVGSRKSEVRDQKSEIGAALRPPPSGSADLRPPTSDFSSSLRDDEVWALRDVSFSVRQGEILGIIGKNGAGKSTLLKILSRVTAPTHGEVRVRGRIASLLEVGTGFHPELTGRENIFLNGAILGMTKAEIKSKLDEIIAFAEVERYIDTPVKRYSSGMYVRLAFAVAAHLEPEILIVDEVLAVGDAAFQKKCLGKMHDVAEHGRTVLFVSHNMIAIQSLCSRAVLLEQGELVLDATAAQTTASYLSAAAGVRRENHWPDQATAPGNDALRIRSIRITPVSRNCSDLITMKSPIRVETDYWVLRAGKTLHLTYHLLNQHGVTVLTTGCPSRQYPTAGSYRGVFQLPGELLNSGDYFLRLLIVEDENQVTYDQENVVSFSVVDADERVSAYMGREPGVVQSSVNWEMSRA